MKIPFTLLAVLLHFYGWSQEVVFKTDYGIVTITSDSTSSLMVFDYLDDNDDPINFNCQLSVHKEDIMIFITNIHGIGFANDIKAFDLILYQGERKETIGMCIYYDSIVFRTPQPTPFSETLVGKKFHRTIFDGEVLFP